MIGASGKTYPHPTDRDPVTVAKIIGGRHMRPGWYSMRGSRTTGPHPTRAQAVEEAHKPTVWTLAP